MTKGSKDVLDLGLFGAKSINKLLRPSSVVIDQTQASISQSNTLPSASFRWDQGWPVGLKSTQQLRLDFSKFENHTFFNSAEVKVNVAFDRVINTFPFDASKVEIEQFFDELGGFENYVLDRWPKSKNFLHFSGTTTEETPRGSYSAELGTHVKVSDHAGTLKPALSKNKTGEAILSSFGRGDLKGSISFEMQLFVPRGAPAPTDTQVIVQKLSGTDSSDHHGITIGLDNIDPDVDPSVTMKKCYLVMIASSGSGNVLSAKMKIKKGGFTHICCVLDRQTSHHKIKLYQSGNFVVSSSVGHLGPLNFAGSDLIIASGSGHVTGTDGRLFNPVHTFSGALDDFRVWHQERTPKDQKEFQLDNVFAQPPLKLYFKFNEPTGSYTSNNILIDSSGNSLHSVVTNFTASLRDKLGLANPMIDERSKFNPVLFPTVDEVVALNADLLNSASLYDAANPNLITRLIPPHYLIQDAYAQGFASEQASIGELYVTGSQSFPGGGTLNSGQIIATLLFVWAKFFDDVKMYVDQFSELINVDYSDDVGVPDHFLAFAAARRGFPMPNMFNNPDILQFLEGEDVLTNKKFAALSLRAVQNQIWRRILVNLNDIIQSKGTVHSIKALFRAGGINPDTNLRLREFGGANIAEVFTKNPPRISSFKVSSMFEMSGGLAWTDSMENEENVQGFHSKMPHFVSPFLSGSRVELGFPQMGTWAGTTSGTMVRPDYIKSLANTKGPLTSTYIYGVSNNQSDGLFTSGSWTYEAFYKFENLSGSLRHFHTQSLVRLETTSSGIGLGGYGSRFASPFLTFNLVALSASNKIVDTGSLKLYARPERIHSTLVKFPDMMRLVLTGVNIFDGGNWHISFGRVRNDQFGSRHSSSYFLRAGKPLNGELAEYYATSSLFGTGVDGYEYATDHPFGYDTQQSYDQDYNHRGYFAAIGSQSINKWAGTLGKWELLNNVPTSITNNKDERGQILTTNFSGRFARLRFWSKALTETETIEHTRNFQSLGVKDPTTNFNFTVSPLGAFEKLRLDVSVDQPITASNQSGLIALTDFSQQFTGTTPGNNDPLPPRPGVGGLPPSELAIKANMFSYSFFNPKFDERSSNNKIRIRSFENFENIERLGGEVAPVYEVPKSERPIDDTRFSVEASVVHALNEDIVNIFATFEKFNEYVGRPELLFAENYPDLRILRSIYFDRLTDKINIKAFFEVFRWLDDSYGILVERLVPSKTKFLGMNFVIESHMLERSKFRYGYINANVPVMLNQFIGVRIIAGPSALIPDWATQSQFFYRNEQAINEAGPNVANVGIVILPS